MRTPILAFSLFAVSYAVATTQTAIAQERPAPTSRGVPSADGGTGVAGLSTGALHLLTLDGEFSQAVAKGGGAAFVQWFADDAVTLSNGQPPVQTKAGIAAAAQWKPGEYTLQWIPMGAQMGPSGDMGFTWGHYDATTKQASGVSPTVKSGRYVTIWKRQPDGKWKVALDASAEEPKP